MSKPASLFSKSGALAVLFAAGVSVTSLDGIPVTSAQSGTPEPSTFALAGLAMALFFFGSRRAQADSGQTRGKNLPKGVPNMSLRHGAILFAGLIFAASLAIESRAGTIAVTPATVLLEDGNASSNGFGTITFSNTGINATASASALLSVGASSSFDGNSAVDGVGSIGAISSLTYYVEAICNPADPSCTSSTNVPLIISAGADAAVSGANQEAYAYVAVNGASDFYVAGACQSTNSYCANGGNPPAYIAAGPDGTVDFSEPALFQYGVTMVAAATSSGAGNSSASADPMISIDPTFLLDNPDFSLLFSSNVDAAAPEPGGIALMLCGVCVILLKASSRQRS
jgi:hypothetical protein